MRILAAFPPSPNLFPSPPPNPQINETLNPPPPPLPLPIKKTRKPPQPPPALRSFHNTTRYSKPVTAGTVTSSSDTSRSVHIGESGVSYILPGSPFEFQFSYSETPKAKPIAVREPLFLPFAPPEMPRPWTGKSPLLSKKEKERKKKIRLFEPLGEMPRGEGKVLKIAGRMPADMGRYVDGRKREEILGEPLTSAEAAGLFRPYLSCNRQVNLGELDAFVEEFMCLTNSVL